MRAVLAPCTAHPTWLIDPDAVLPLAVPLQGFEPIAGEHLQCPEGVGSIQDTEALVRLAGERLKLAHIFPVPQRLYSEVFAAVNHAFFLAQRTLYVKRTTPTLCRVVKTLTWPRADRTIQSYAQEQFSWAGLTNRASSSVLIVARPGDRRFCEPTNGLTAC
jgi:hypothetical protein